MCPFALPEAPSSSRGAGGGLFAYKKKKSQAAQARHGPVSLPREEKRQNQQPKEGPGKAPSIPPNNRTPLTGIASEPIFFLSPPDCCGHTSNSQCRKINTVNIGRVVHSHNREVDERVHPNHHPNNKLPKNKLLFIHFLHSFVSGELSVKIHTLYYHVQSILSTLLNCLKSTI